MIENLCPEYEGDNEKVQVTGLIVCAASSDGNATGSTFMYKYGHDNDNHWEHSDYLSVHGNNNTTCLLAGIVTGSKYLAEEVSEEYTLKIHCEVNSDAVVTGYNTHLKTWVTNDFVGSTGKRVAAASIWKQLSELSEQHEITIERPKHYIAAHKGCANRAKGALKEVIEFKNDPAMREVLVELLGEF